MKRLVITIEVTFPYSYDPETDTAWERRRVTPTTHRHAKFRSARHRKAWRGFPWMVYSYTVYHNFMK